MGSGDIAPGLYASGRNLRYKLDRRLGGPQSQTGEKSLPPPQIEALLPRSSTTSLDIVLTDLSQILNISYDVQYPSVITVIIIISQRLDQVTNSVELIPS
jgi:hypothetical protein